MIFFTHLLIFVENLLLLMCFPRVWLWFVFSLIDLNSVYQSYIWSCNILPGPWHIPEIKIYNFNEKCCFLKEQICDLFDFAITIEKIILSTVWIICSDMINFHFMYFSTNVVIGLFL
jgi:hypothetical protein